MSFGCNLAVVMSVSRFEKAETMFNETKLPRSFFWRDGTRRPLADSSKPHYALHKIDDDAYGVSLYNMDVIIYYRPKDNTCVRKFIGSHHQATRGWLWMHARMLSRNRLTTTTGREVMVPISIYSSTVLATVASGDDRGKLIESASSHPQMFTYVSTAEDKEKRAAFKKKIDTLVELALHTLVWNVGSHNNYYKRLFEGMLASSGALHELRWRTQEAAYAIAAGADISSEVAEPIIAAANYAYNSYEEQPDVLAFRKLYIAWLVRLAHLNHKSGKKMLPMFPDADSVPNVFSTQ